MFSVGLKIGDEEQIVGLGVCRSEREQCYQLQLGELKLILEFDEQVLNILVGSGHLDFLNRKLYGEHFEEGDQGVDGAGRDEKLEVVELV